MKGPLSDVLGRLSGLGADKWAVHFRGRAMAAAGEDVIELTIGEPDRAPDPALFDALEASLRAGRTRYADGRGEPGLRAAVAARYAARAGRPVSAEQVLAVPGTQAALFASIMALAGPGDEVALPDPYYATYDGVIRAAGAELRRVPMPAATGFRLTPAALEAALTPRVKVLLLNNPHNPTGTVLDRAEIEAVAALCRARGIRIVSDEVYEELIFDPALRFVSPFDLPGAEDFVVTVGSISKSHAAPGFRSGWMVSSQAFRDAVQPLVEMMFFGNQPFIADATAFALTHPSPTAGLLRDDYRRRAAAAAAILGAAPGLAVLMPQAGMFLMLDVTRTGLDGEGFALSLLEAERVSVMPGAAFGREAAGWVRLSLTLPDERLAEACRRIARHAGRLLAAPPAPAAAR